MGEHVQDLVQFHGGVIPAIDADIAGAADFLESSVGVTIEMKGARAIALP